MPNWVRNILSVSGDEKAIQRMMESIRDEATIFDFNKVIPMPDELDVESNSTLRNSYVVYSFLKEGPKSSCAEAFNYFMNCHKEKNESLDEFIERLKKTDWIDMSIGKIGYENAKKYGHIDWYCWRVDKWGTKWNACEVSLRDSANQLEFDTAWSAPVPVVQKLAEMFPELSFVHKWADEDTGCNTGHMEYENGQRTFESIPENCSAIAYEIYAYCWDVYDFVDDGEND